VGKALKEEENSAITCSLTHRDDSRQPYNRLSVLHTHSYICLVLFSRVSDFQGNGKYRSWYSPTL
jgi:hypothetical protein